MNSTCRRGVVLALVLIAVASWVALANPSFSDQNTGAGNLNPTDEIVVMEVRVRGDTTYASTLSSVTVQNVGTATSSQIDRIRILDGGTELGRTTNLSGLSTGVTVNLGGYNVAKGTTHYIRVLVMVGGSVSGGETIELRLKFHYELRSTPAQSKTSAWISDRTAETIRDGGFDAITSNAVATKYLNPLDTGTVQIAVFSDLDANGNDVNWVQTPSATVIVEVENLGSGTTSDIDEIRVVLRIGGVDYVTWDTVDEWLNWDPASPMPFTIGDFAISPGHGSTLPVGTPDNSGVTVTVQMKIEDQGDVSDNRTIRTRTTLHVKEGLPGNEVNYDQMATSGSTVTIRKQGFEEITEESGQVVSGTKATGETLIQTVKAIDEDSNGNNIRATQIEIQNLGSATGAELNSIEVKAGTTQLVKESDAADLADFGAGIVLDLAAVAASLVADDGELELKIYYELAQPIDGHTLQPQVRVRGTEVAGGANQYWSDSVVFPGVVTLYEAGLEIAENLTPPEGGTVYSGQRVEVQRIWGMDIDENTEALTMHPFVIKNLGTAQENPDVVKIEIMRSDTEDGAQVLMGSETDLAGFRTGGVRIDTIANNQMLDKTAGSEIYIHIWVTIAEPEVMVAGRTLQLETRILHTENLVSYDKTIVGNSWSLATNHRPVPNFTFAAADAGTASIGPKADYSTTDTIQFTGTATDPDSDAIVSWHWDFGDGNTADVQNPTHQFATGGTFTVKLTVTDARGVTGTVTQTIEIEGPPNEVPVIDEIAADPQNPGVGVDVDFTVTITDDDQPPSTAFTYAWDFDDGTTSTVAAPTKSFATAGTFTVTVTVTDAQAATDTATIDVSVGNEKPVADFTASTTTPSTGDAVQFTDTSTDPNDDPADTPFTYAWDFGDGATSTAENPSHTYTTPATYAVTLTVTDNRGGVSDETSTDITVSGPTRVVLYSFPNPAATTATINYFLPTGATAPELRIFDLSGKQILRQTLAAGETQFEWDLRNEGGTAISNGLYFCMITATSAAGQTITSEVFQLLVAR